MNITTRKQAVEAGLKRYFTGQPCPKGHIAERRVSGACIECARKDSRERNNANWQSIGKEKNKEWRKANAEKVSATSRAYRESNAEQVKAWKSANQKLHRDSANARSRRYFASHREELNAKIAAWALANPAKNTAKSNRYRAAKLQAMPAWANQDHIDGMYELAQVFRNVGLDVHVDHIVPLQGRNVRGLHVADNLQIIHATINRQKSNQLHV